MSPFVFVSLFCFPILGGRKGSPVQIFSFFFFGINASPFSFPCTICIGSKLFQCAVPLVTIMYHNRHSSKTQYHAFYASGRFSLFFSFSCLVHATQLKCKFIN